MKNRYKIAKHWIVFLLLTTISACEKFLEVDPPPSKIGTEDAFQSDATATAAVLGIYSNSLLNPSSFARGNQTSISSLTGLSSDELVNHRRLDNNMVDIELNFIKPDNPYMLSLWSSLYKAIYSSNLYIEKLKASNKIDGAIRDQLLGEVHFIRAFCNFHLVNLFGDIPLVLTSDYLSNAIVPRTASGSIYDQIEIDLIAARDLLSENYVATASERIRPNSLCAIALLARVYLYKEDWANAELAATKVIDRTDLYEIMDDLSSVFLKNSREAIWQLMPSTVDGKGTTAEAETFGPNRVLGYNKLRKSSLEMFNPGDLRLTYWVDTMFVNSDTIFVPTKYKQWNSNLPMTEYSMVLRIAEQYLIRAEARAMQGILIGENSAVADLNRVRNRAGLNDSDAAEVDDIMDAIISERRAEFFTEWGHRWFDLKRTGRVVEALSALKSDISVNDALYPIPSSEFTRNPNLRPQNTGY